MLRQRGGAALLAQYSRRPIFKLGTDSEGLCIRRNIYVVCSLVVPRQYKWVRALSVSHYCIAPFAPPALKDDFVGF